MPLKFLSSPFKKTTPHQVSHLSWQEYEVEVTRKAMKSIRLKLSANGDLRVSCPHFVNDSEIRQFLEERHDWIQKHRTKLAARQALNAQTIPPDHLMLWGEQQAIPDFIDVSDNDLLHVAEHELEEIRHQILRNQLKAFIADSLPHWQTKMQVQAQFWNVRKMKTKWGSCNVHRQRIWLNTQLARFPRVCAEMVLVHELAHLIEASHNRRFYQIMDTYLPSWREADELLKNRGLSF